MIKGSNQRRDVDCCLSSYQTAKSGDTVLPFDNLYYKSDRSGSCYEQSFLDVLEKIIQKCIYLPIYHTLTFYCLHFSKKKTPCFLHFSKAKLSISLHFSKIKTSFFLHFSKMKTCFYTYWLHNFLNFLFRLYNTTPQ